MVKNISKLALLIIISYLILPSGDPTDFFITLPIISLLGFKLYLILSIILIFYLYKHIEGKTLQAKFNMVKKEMRSLL